MITNIKVKNVGPISNEINLDFGYASYVNKNYYDALSKGEKMSWLDNESQVDRVSRISLVKCLMGMNGTGKSSIVAALKVLKSAWHDHWQHIDIMAEEYFKKSKKKIIFPNGDDIVFMTDDGTSVPNNAVPMDFDLLQAFLNHYAREFVTNISKSFRSKSVVEITKDDNSTLTLEKTEKNFIAEWNQRYDYIGDIAFVHKEYKDAKVYHLKESTTLFEIITKVQNDWINKMKSKKNRDSYNYNNILFLPSYSVDDSSIVNRVYHSIPRDTNSRGYHVTEIESPFAKEIKAMLPFSDEIDVIDIADRKVDESGGFTTTFGQMINLNTVDNYIAKKVKGTFHKFISMIGSEKVVEFLKLIDPKIDRVDHEWANDEINRHDEMYKRHGPWQIVLSDWSRIYPMNLSSGTKQLILFITEILEAFHSKKGKLIMIDELSNGLQYRLVEKIVSLFSDPELNVNKSQLLFTSHNIELVAKKQLDQKNYIILRRNEYGNVETITLFDFLLKHTEAGRAAVHPKRGLLSYMDHFYSSDGGLEDSKYLKGVRNPFLIPKENVDSWNSILKVDKKRPK